MSGDIFPFGALQSDNSDTAFPKISHRFFECLNFVNILRKSGEAISIFCVLGFLQQIYLATFVTGLSLCLLSVFYHVRAMRK
jgi:hypothetical protein